MQRTSAREIVSFFGCHLIWYIINVVVIFPMVLSPIYMGLREHDLSAGNGGIIIAVTSFGVAAVSWVVVFIAFVLLRGQVGQESDRQMGGF